LLEVVTDWSAFEVTGASHRAGFFVRAFFTIWAVCFLYNAGF
jgi:hypothetical protein